MYEFLSFDKYLKNGGGVGPWTLSAATQLKTVFSPITQKVLPLKYEIADGKFTLLINTTTNHYYFFKTLGILQKHLL